jgi:hypothetical protein
MDALASSLSDLAGAAFRWSAVAFLLVNGVAALVLWITRDRRLVNRFTSPLLAANLLLLGTGVGLPVLAGAMRLVVTAVGSVEAPAGPVSADRIQD